jgi:chromosome segregation ATPase
LPNEHRHPDDDLDIATKLRQAERNVTLGNAETKRREREIRELRAELRESTARLEESHATVELLASRAADALTEKNRAQRRAWELQERLQGTPRSRARSKRRESEETGQAYACSTNVQATAAATS